MFIGYTNVITDAKPGYTAWMTKAIIEVTNCGSVAVDIEPIWRVSPPIRSGRAGSYLLVVRCN
jgi:hypothetical protein